MDHIAVYGPDNDKRLTGKHETAPWNKFSYGVADRGASIRVPHSFVNNGYKGYLEDRRPNSQGDPYQIACQVLKTISEVPTGRCEEGSGLIKSGASPRRAVPSSNRRRQKWRRRFRLTATAVTIGPARQVDAETQPIQKCNLRIPLPLTEAT